MLTNNLILVFAIGGVLGLLSILQFFLAARHDQVVTAEGPVQSLAALDAQIRQRRDLIADIDQELTERREALKNFAAIQADVEEYTRRREELLAEWNSMEERRSEVRQVRAEMEEAIGQKQLVDGELSSALEELAAVREHYEKTQKLLARADSLKEEHDQLLTKVSELQDMFQVLDDSKAQVADLEAKSMALTSRNAQLEGSIAAQSDQLAELSTRLAAEREQVAEVAAEHVGLSADRALLEEALRTAAGQMNRLGDRRSELEARVAVLKALVDQSEGKGTSISGEAANPLRELKTLPPVLLNLKGWKSAPLRTEQEALHRVGERLKDSGLEYHSRVVRAFHTAMKVNETTQMAVLAGISGTGKSQLPRVYAAGMGIGFLQVPVQPRWDSPQDLMGFYNYIEQRYRPTDMARALWHLDELNNPETELKDRMMLILLDEMNLARVEYYFSDFLSRLESRPTGAAVAEKNLRKDAEIELEIPTIEGGDPPRIFPGYNLLFAGTMNEDESTQSLSDKVVDRANVLRFAAPKRIMPGGIAKAPAQPEALSRNAWKSWVKTATDVESDPFVSGSIDKVVGLMRDFKRPIGHRVGRAILAYAANYPQAGGSDRLRDALADQIEMRLLPKLRGVDVADAASAFSDLQTFVEHELHDQVLASGISHSLESAQAGTGQFVWQGVTRE
jgi:hypothetical protein